MIDPLEFVQEIEETYCKRSRHFTLISSDNMVEGANNVLNFSHSIYVPEYLKVRDIKLNWL